MESATAADGTSHIIRAEMDGEGTCVEDVTTRELGGLVCVVVGIVIGMAVSCGFCFWALSPDPADAVNTDVRDWDVEHSTLLARGGGSEEDVLWLTGLACPSNARVILVATLV